MDSEYHILLYQFLGTVQLRFYQGARWRSGKASYSELKGPRFDPHRWHRVVSFSKSHLLPTVLIKPRKRWLHPDMTEKLLTGTLSLNTNFHNVISSNLGKKCLFFFHKIYIFGKKGFTDL